jgi:hypothetical protein
MRRRAASRNSRPLSGPGVRRGGDTQPELGKRDVHGGAARIDRPGGWHRRRTAADTFLAGLEAAEFALRGHILADIALITDARRDGGGSVLLQLEALTVKDD